MNENDFRDIAALFGVVGLVMAYKDNHPESVLAERAYAIADAMVEARSQPDEELGIAAVKPKRKYARKEA